MAARGALAPTEEDRGGTREHIVAAACLQLVFINLPRSGKLPVLNLLRGRKSSWRLVTSIYVKFGMAEGHVGPLALAKFHANRCTGWIRVTRPQKSKIFTFGKDSPRRGEPLHRFRKVLEAFMRPTILH